MNTITVNPIETDEITYKVGTIFIIAGDPYMLCTIDDKVLKLISLRGGGRWSDINLYEKEDYTTYDRIKNVLRVDKWSIFEGSLTITTKKE